MVKIQTTKKQLILFPKSINHMKIYQTIKSCLFHIRYQLSSFWALIFSKYKSGQIKSISLLF